MILLIDNYDSFVYNLARYIVELGYDIQVVRNDKIDSVEVRSLQPQALIFSPGPCTPDQAGNSLNLVSELAAEFPMLGVCLGHQTIAQAFGGRIRRAVRPVHGMTSLITHTGSHLFKGLANPLKVTRYHSLIAELPENGPLIKIAYGPEGEVMAFAHRSQPVFGVQFHPEAILTQQGHELLNNFLNSTQSNKRSSLGAHSRMIS